MGRGYIKWLAFLCLMVGCSKTPSVSSNVPKNPYRAGSPVPSGLVLVDESGKLITETHRVTVAYPPGWALHEYRNCALGPTELRGWPVLACEPLGPWLDFQSSPGEHMLVMDVEFSGGYSFPALNPEASWWTCQKETESLICRR